MPGIHILSTRRARISAASAILIVVSLTAAACGSSGSSSKSSGNVPQASAKVNITLGLSYIPNIQFSPFYVAEAKGFFARAGLNVTLHHHSFAESEFGDISAGREDVLYAGGDEMMQARQSGVPIVDVVTLYQEYPVGLIVPAGSPIKTVADLRGHTVGVPGPYGETYFGLKALLRGAGLNTSDTHVQNIGFTQVAALIGHKVDAVMGYVNNDAIQMRLAHFPVRVFPLSTVINPLPLIGDGLVVKTSFLQTHAAAVRKLVEAVIAAERYVATHVSETLAISKQYVPGLSDPTQLSEATAVLRASIPLWGLDSSRPGYNNPASWQAMASFMLSQGFITKKPDVSAAFSNNYQ